MTARLRGSNTARRAVGGVAVVALVGALLVFSTGTAGAGGAPVAFAPPVSYEVDSGSRSVAIGDLDGDSYDDVVAVGTEADEVSVLFGNGNGDGSLAPPIGLGTGPVPTAVAIGDLDGDLDLDLVVTNSGRSFDYDDTSVSVLLNHGDGTFAPDVVIPAYFGPVDVVIEDVNGDGDADLVLTHNGFLSIGLSAGRVSVMLGNGAGGFALGYTTMFGPMDFPGLRSAVGEVTGDAHLDIVVVGWIEEPARLWVLVGNGNGTFDPPVLYEDDDSPLPDPYDQAASAVAIGDLDGDGANELVASYCCTTTGGYLAVLGVAADGTVAEATAYPAGTYLRPETLALGDVNGDGNLDVVAASDDDAVGVFLGDGDGSLDAPTPIPTPDTWSTELALADVDDDDRLDIVTGGYTDVSAVSVLINETVLVAPSAPTIGSATAGNGQATVSWTAPASDGGSPITGYVVTPYVGVYPLPSQSFGPTPTTQVVTGLTNGTKYRFRVQAVNALGTSGYSTVTNQVTPAVPTVPGAPTLASATVGNAEATVSWTAPAFDGTSAITGYVVTPYVGYFALPAQSFGPTPTTQVVTGLTNGTAYRFRVQAVNAVGTGAVSNITNAVTPFAPTVPGAPTAASATRWDGQATVSWTAPTSNGGSAITGYVVTPYVGYYALPSQSFGPTPTTRVVTGLTNGTTYRFRVQAVNAVGTGGVSNITNAVTPVVITVPGAPTLATATATAGTGEATVSWTAPSFDGNSPLTGYTVTGFVGFAPMVAETFSATSTTQVMTGLSSGTKYKFRVNAVNAYGTGAASNLTAAVTP